MKIGFILKETIHQDEQIRYWFEVAGEGYCLCDEKGALNLEDSEGYPIEECNDHDGIKNALIAAVAYAHLKGETS